MNFKTTYILFGTLAVILVIFWATLWVGPLPKDAAGHVLARLHDTVDPINTNDIDEVTIEREKPEKATWRFVKDPDTERWTITEPRQMRGNKRTIEDLITQIRNARRDKDADKAPSLPAWGLEPPQETITLKRSSPKTELQLKIGDVTGGDRSAVIYALAADRPNDPMAVRKSELSEVLQGLEAYRDRDLLSPSSSDIQAIKLSETDKGAAKLGPVELVKKKERWYYEKPFTGDADVEGDTGVAPAGEPPSGLQGLLTELTSLRVDYNSEKDNDFVANDVSDLAKYGLGKDDPILRIEIKRVDQIKKRSDKKKDDKDEKKEEPEVKTSTIGLLVAVGKKVGDKNDKYYALREGEKDVVRVSAKNIEPLVELLKKPDALRDRHLVRLDNFRQPDAIDVKNDSGLLEFRHPDAGKPWQVYRGDTLVPSTETAIKGLISLLTDRRKDITFLDSKTSDSEVGLDKPAAVVSLWVDGLLKEEKKDDKKETKKDDKKDDKKPEGEKKESTRPKLKEPAKPTFRLTFAAPKDARATEVVVKREGEGEETALLRVPILIYERVKEGPLFYMDRTLPQFNPGSFEPAKDVTKVVIDSGSGITELTRENKPDAPWKIDKPSALKGREADKNVVQGLLGQLNSLQALKLVAEEAKGDDLEKKYGLKPPVAKVVVTVTKDGKPTDYEFDFGKDEAASVVYAKQSQRGMIFTVEKTLVNSLKDPVLDKTIFKFDPAKAKSVKLVGWQKVTSAPYTLEAERKDDKWTVKAPAGFNLDGQKITELVANLSNLRAEKFLAHGSKPKPEQELEVAKGALQIEVVVEGEKQPFTLTIGKAEENGYVAVSDRLPGDVFIVGKSAFEGPLSKPAYFSP